MGLVYAVVAIAAAAFSARAVRSPFVDGDLFWQKHLGAYVLANHALPHALGNETFTAPGAPWTPQEWLFGVLASLAIAGGALWLLSLCAGLAVGLALILCGKRARLSSASGLSAAFALALAAIAVEGSFGVRAQVLAWPLFCALLVVLELSGGSIFWALPVVALWANLHGSVMIALPLVWIDALAHLYRDGPHARETRARLLLSVLVPLAILCTPLTWHLPAYAIELVRSPIRHSIDEWQPVAARHDFFWYGAFPLVLLVLASARTLVRERLTGFAWVVLFAAMAASAVRNVPLLGFAAAPLAARSVDVLLARFAWWPVDPLRSPGPRRLALVATAAVAAAVFVFTLRQGTAHDKFHPPVATFDRIAAMPGEPRIFCFDFAVCSIALDHPNERVFMDGRADPYPVWVWDDFNLIRHAWKGWSARLDAYGVDVVVTKKDDALDRAIKKQRAWKVLPADDRCCRAYVRRNPVPSR